MDLPCGLSVGFPSSLNNLATCFCHMHRLAPPTTCTALPKTQPCLSCQIAKNTTALPHHVTEWYTYVKCSHVPTFLKEGWYVQGMFSPGEDYVFGVWFLPLPLLAQIPLTVRPSCGRSALSFACGRHDEHVGVRARSPRVLRAHGHPARPPAHRRERDGDVRPPGHAVAAADHCGCAAGGERRARGGAERENEERRVHLD